MPDPQRRTALFATAALTIAALAAALPAAAQPSPAAASATPFKVGYVYVSPIGDAGWTFQPPILKPTKNGRHCRNWRWPPKRTSRNLTFGTATSAQNSPNSASKAQQAF